MDKTLRTLFAGALWAWIFAALLSTFLVVGTVMAAEPDPGPAVDPLLTKAARQLATEAGQRANASLPNARVEVQVGQLDARLHLAPCQKVQPYLPDGTRPWGKTRIGLRCLQGQTLWNVYLPVTVSVFARGLVAASSLPAGTVLTATDLNETEVDLAAAPTIAITQPDLAVGRTLARALNTGDAVRQGDLKSRQYFSTGATVDVVALGSGFQVNGQGQAMQPGLEGQIVKVRTSSGRIISGVAAGERRVEIQL